MTQWRFAQYAKLPKECNNCLISLQSDPSRQTEAQVCTTWIPKVDKWEPKLGNDSTYFLEGSCIGL